MKIERLGHCICDECGECNIAGVRLISDYWDNSITVCLKCFDVLVKSLFELKEEITNEEKE